MNRPTPSRPNRFLLALAYIGFVSLGLPDAVIGVAWPSIRDTFHLRQGAVGFVFVVAGLGYLVSSFLSGRLMHSVGIGLVLTASTGLVATAMFGFALAPIWVAFVFCALIHGLGSGAIDSGLNGYAAHFMSARQLIWLHACYCVGAMLGPLLMSWVLASGRHYSAGYEVVGGVMVAMSILFLITYRQWGAASAHAEHVDRPVGAGGALKYSAVWFQMGVFFLYTGLEVTFSQWTFTVLTESRQVDPASAGIAVGTFWASLGAGRVVFGFVADQVGIDRLLRYCLVGLVVGAILYAGSLPVEAAFVGLSVAGFCLAPVFPCLMSRTPQRLGTALSVHAIGFQVGSAMIGAAAVPGTLGVIASRYGIAVVPIGTVVLSALLWLLHERLLRLPGVRAESG